MRGAVLGFLLGAIAVSCWIGGAIGWEQRHLWPAWLGVPMGVGMGPMYLIGDLMTISDGSSAPFIALPQSLLGGAVGGLLGWLVERIKRK